MRVVSLTARKPLPMGTIPAKIEVTLGSQPLAESLVNLLSRAGADAQVVAHPTGQADATLVTEGFATLQPATRHWQTLAACRAAKGTRICLLSPDLPEVDAQTSGLAGLARTLRKEWSNANIAGFSISANDWESCAKLAISALSAGIGDSVIHSDGTYQSQSLGEPLAPPASQCVTSSGTWLVTGGARGVTADCAVELAQRTGGIFLLAGRSAPMPWPDDMPVTDNLMTLRGHLAKAAIARGEKPTPADLDRLARQLLAGVDIRRTLDRFTAIGVSAHYVQIDMSDTVALPARIAALQAQYGAVTGLIHGAGLLADKLADQKTEDEVTRVFGPKVDGLLGLLAALDVSKLSHVGLFSSAAAVFGNTGQSDYAMANEILGQIARKLSATRPNIRACSFAWGPWDGGMVDDTLAQHFHAQGISLISIEDGARIFADQLLTKDTGFSQLLIGDMWSTA